MTTQAHPRLREPKPQLDLVDGQWVAPAGRLSATVDDPNTGLARQPQTATDAVTLERGLAAATALHVAGTWADASVETRVRLLDLIAAGLSARSEEVGYEDAMSNGNPLSVATQVASYLGPRVESARNQVLEIGESTVLSEGERPVRLLRRPLGPAVVLAPWNAPTFVAVAKVASALAAGCPVILKPSEWAPGGCQVLAEVIEAAVAELGLPRALFQLVHGGAAVGSQLVSDARVKAISFTGGGPGGRAVATAAAAHLTQLQLELGSHNPAVVLPDADVAAAAAAIAEGMTKLNGQWCEAPGKILVPAELHDEFVDALLAELAAYKVGHCLDEDTVVGPLAYGAHRAKLQQQIDDLVARGGKALTAADVPALDGWFLAPTVVVGLPAEESTRELFGPAITVHAVSSLEDALRGADGPEIGLAGFVFGRDIAAAMDVAGRLDCGEVRINGCKLADLADGSEQSFWNASGIGGHGPTDMVRFFQGRRTIGLDDPALPI